MLDACLLLGTYAAAGLVVAIWEIRSLRLEPDANSLPLATLIFCVWPVFVGGVIYERLWPEGGAPKAS